MGETLTTLVSSDQPEATSTSPPIVTNQPAEDSIEIAQLQNQNGEASSSVNQYEAQAPNLDRPFPGTNLNRENIYELEEGNAVNYSNLVEMGQSKPEHSVSPKVKASTATEPSPSGASFNGSHQVRVRITEPNKAQNRSTFTPSSVRLATRNKRSNAGAKSRGRTEDTSPRPRHTISSPITNPIRKEAAGTSDPWARGVCSICMEKYVVPTSPPRAVIGGNAEVTLATPESNNSNPESGPANKSDPSHDREAVCLPGCGHAFCRACITSYLDRRTNPKKKRAPRDSTGALEAVVIEEGDAMAEDEALAAALAAQAGVSKVERWLGFESGTPAPDDGRISALGPASVRSGTSAGAPSTRHGAKSIAPPGTTNVREGASPSLFSGRTGRSNVRSIIAAASARFGGSARGETPIPGLPGGSRNLTPIPGATVSFRGATPVPGGGLVGIGEGAMLSVTIYCPLCRKSSTVTRIGMKPLYIDCAGNRKCKSRNSVNLNKKSGL